MLRYYVRILLDDTSHDVSRQSSHSEHGPGRLVALKGLEPRGEMPEPGRLLDNAIATELRLPGGSRSDHFPRVVHVALRIGSPRDREPHQLHCRGRFGAGAIRLSKHDG